MERFRFIRPKSILLLKNLEQTSKGLSPSNSNLCLIKFNLTTELELFYKIFKRFNNLIINEFKAPYKIGLCFDSRQV